MLASLMEEEGQQEDFCLFVCLKHYSFGGPSQNGFQWTEIQVWAGLHSFLGALGRHEIFTKLGP